MDSIKLLMLLTFPLKGKIVLYLTIVYYSLSMDKVMNQLIVQLIDFIAKYFS